MCNFNGLFYITQKAFHQKPPEMSFSYLYRKGSGGTDVVPKKASTSSSREEKRKSAKFSESIVSDVIRILFTFCLILIQKPFMTRLFCFWGSGI